MKKKSTTPKKTTWPKPSKPKKGKKSGADEAAAPLANELTLEQRVLRIEAFIGSAMTEATPPLDGAQIATKAFVDHSVNRLGEVLHKRIAEIRAEAAKKPSARPSLGERLAKAADILSGRSS